MNIRKIEQIWIFQITDVIDLIAIEKKDHKYLQSELQNKGFLTTEEHCSKYSLKGIFEINLCCDIKLIKYVCLLLLLT